MKNYITQYKVVFCLSWVILYLLFPSWISKHSIVQERFPELGYSFARFIIILMMGIYFLLSACLVDRYFNAVTVHQPFIVRTRDWLTHIKNNRWLVVACLLSVVLHLHTFSYVTILGELPFLERTFWIYNALAAQWYRLFSFPFQYLFWVLIGVFIFRITRKKMINAITDFISERVSDYKSSSLMKVIFISTIFFVLAIYSNLFPYYSYVESMKLIRYPPFYNFFYLTSYFAFGLSDLGPRVIQFVFYLLSALYLYRTISLYNEKEVALSGAVIYLFSPIIFSYASQAALTSGTVFFLILISFYFLRFIKDDDIRDLILTSYILGIGFLYKRVILIMFIICFAYLVLNKIRKRDGSTFIHFKILLLSLIPILPWLKIGPSMYKAIWSNLVKFDEMSVFAMMIQSQLSWIIFLLFLCSLVFIITVKRDDLTLFYGIYFAVYYVFYTLMEVGEFNYRYSLTLYPAISVILSQFIAEMTQRVRWKYAFAVVMSILTVYMAGMSLVPRTSTNLTTWRYRDFETQYYPFDKATDWLRNETGDSERILVLYIRPYMFYVDSIYPDRTAIGNREFIFLGPSYGAKEIIYPVQNFNEYCRTENISYIVFPFSPNNVFPEEATPLIETLEMTKYLKENMSDEFIKAAEFGIEDNYIFIYKLKETS